MGAQRSTVFAYPSPRHRTLAHAAHRSACPRITAAGLKTCPTTYTSSPISLTGALVISVAFDHAGGAAGRTPSGKRTEKTLFASTIEPTERQVQHRWPSFLRDGHGYEGLRGMLKAWLHPRSPRHRRGQPWCRIMAPGSLRSQRPTSTVAARHMDCRAAPRRLTVPVCLLVGKVSAVGSTHGHWLPSIGSNIGGLDDAGERRARRLTHDDPGAEDNGQLLRHVVVGGGGVHSVRRTASRTSRATLRSVTLSSWDWVLSMVNAASSSTP